MLLSSYLRLSSVHENDDSAAGNPWFEVIVMVWLLTVSSSFQSWCQSAVAGLVAVSEESCAWIVGRQMCVMGVSVNRLCRPITIFVVTHQMRHLLHMRRDLLIWWEEDNWRGQWVYHPTANQESIVVEINKQTRLYCCWYFSGVCFISQFGDGWNIRWLQQFTASKSGSLHTFSEVETFGVARLLWWNEEQTALAVVLVIAVAVRKREVLLRGWWLLKDCFDINYDEEPLDLRWKDWSDERERETGKKKSQKCNVRVDAFEVTSLAARLAGWWKWRWH